MCIVLLVCLNLPPWVRYLPGFAVLLGAIPGPKCGNYQTYMRYVADQFEALGDGIYAHDAYENKEVFTPSQCILPSRWSLHTLFI